MKSYHLISCILAALVFVSCTKTAEQEKPPNIVIILTDDQGWGDLSFHGNTNFHTPHIDSIALQGCAVENFYVQPVCSPTRAELLTGHYASSLGVYATSAGGERMNLGIPTLAEIFREAGYTTGAFGKWHNGTQPPYHPNSRGFQEFYGFCSGHWGNYFSPMLEKNGAIIKGEGFLVDDLFNQAMSFIENQKDPFLVYLPLNTPHSPMQSPDSFWESAKERTIKMTSDQEEDLNFTKAAIAMVENIDWNVGRFTNFLRTKQLEDNTIVIFMSDNGPNGWRWNGQMKGKKGSTDEGGVKSPFFIKWPEKIKSSTTSTQLMGSVDLLPTLVNLTSLPIPEGLTFHGKDLSSAFLESNDQDQPNVVYNHWNGKTSIRTGHYRLDDTNQLYNLKEDRGQTQDIGALVPDIRDSLIQLKQTWRSTHNSAPELNPKRPFPIGDTLHGFAQLPARDGIAHGTILRSNRWPNDSFYTNWTKTTDSITWDVDVLNEGVFEVYLYYTCKPEDIGTTLSLSLNGNEIQRTISEAHDPPLQGASKDRYPRMEGYVKEFKPVKMGELTATKGLSTLSLKATSIPGTASIDFRLLYFKRKGS